MDKFGRLGIRVMMNFHFPATFVMLTVSGEMAEWSKAAVLKTVDGKPSGGSNPSLSANSKDNIHNIGKLLVTFNSPPISPPNTHTSGQVIPSPIS